MTRLRLVSAAALFALSSSLAFAQAPAAPTTAPKAPAASPPPVVTTAPAPAPAVAAPKANAEQAKKINLNTATAAELDNLPQIGPARAKDIIEARTKGKFKDWADFTTRKVVPANAESAIKDLVAF
jgi:competence protein ComEA